MFAWQKMLKYRQAAATAQKQASYTFYQNQRGLGCTFKSDFVDFVMFLRFTIMIC